MYQQNTYFGDTSLEELGLVVEAIHDDPPEFREESASVPGRHGTCLRSVTLGPRAIRLECRALLDEWESFDRLRDTLMARLATFDERRLSTRRHPGDYYLCHLSSVTEGDRVGGSGIGAIELEFTASDPIRYGEEHRVTVPSGGSVTFGVSGTAPTLPTIAATAARRSPSTGLWGLRLDGGDYLRVALPTAYATAVSADCGTREVRVAGAATMITTDSDWLELSPGSHVLDMDQGTGAATVTWQERSL